MSNPSPSHAPDAPREERAIRFGLETPSEHQPQMDSVPMDAYDYGLPDSAIAQEPIEPRSAARLLVAPSVSTGGTVEHRIVADLAAFLRPGDVVVVNDTSVLRARLVLHKASGGVAEILLLEPREGIEGSWEALVRPGRRLPPGTLLYEDVPGGMPVVEVGQPLAGASEGRRSVRLIDPSVVDRAGVLPLPPYIHRSPRDPDRYQTVYASPREPGDRSVAAPTAGLHFTPELLDRCRDAGATIATVDLAIGLDTFRPITAPTPDQHVMHSERYSVPAETMAACARATRVVAVGTTVVRSLEAAAATGRLTGRTDLFIRGTYPFAVVDVLVTNFHLPRSSLLLLVEAFCGSQWRELYATALAEGYRFLSFGDAMIVARSGEASSRPSTPPLPT